MTPEDIPPRLKAILDQRARKVHKNNGAVMSTLAEILTEFVAELPPAYDELLEEWSKATGGDKLSLRAWADLRLDLMKEEYREWRDALEYFVETGDAKPMAKESADVMYILYGSVARPGIDMDAAFREVHDSNMSKFGPNGEVYERPDGKILKGSNYREADMTKAVKS